MPGNKDQELDQAVTTYLQSELPDVLEKAKYHGKIENQNTVDERNEDGSLVDQSVKPLPLNPDIILALSETEAFEMRMANLAGRNQSLLQLQIKYAAYVDENSFRSPKSVFTGPHHPWHYTWIQDYEKGRDRVTPLSDVGMQELETLLFLGYRPADFRKLAPLFVSGERAALLSISRRRSFVEKLMAKGTPAPPILPADLFDKFGMLMPPAVNFKDGTLWIGSQRLYVIEKAVADQRFLDNRKKAALQDQHQFDPAKGVYKEQSTRSVIEIPIDEMLPRRNG